jgi:hypothetical protein
MTFTQVLYYYIIISHEYYANSTIDYELTGNSQHLSLGRLGHLYLDR